MNFSIEQIQDKRPDKKNGVARNYEHREPHREFSAFRFNLAPARKAQRNDTAQQQSLVSNGIENDSEYTALVISSSNVTVESVAYRGENENCDCGEPLPLQRLAAFNAFTIVNRHSDEGRDHHDPDNRDFVGGSHGARVTQTTVGRFIRSRQRAHPFGLPVYVASRAQAPFCETPRQWLASETEGLQLSMLFLRPLMPWQILVTQQWRLCAGLQRILQSFFG